MQVQPVFRVFGKQIADFLVVDLEVGGTNEELSLLGVSLNALKDVGEATRHDAHLNRVSIDAGHGVRLACAGLTISENGAIVAL